MLIPNGTDPGEGEINGVRKEEIFVGLRSLRRRLGMSE